jgi:hypothetical protein
MRLAAVTLSRTYNLGNYESKRVEITIEIPADTNDAPTLEQLKTAGWAAVHELARTEGHTP